MLAYQFCVSGIAKINDDKRMENIQDKNFSFFGMFTSVWEADVRGVFGSPEQRTNQPTYQRTKLHRKSARQSCGYFFSENSSINKVLRNDTILN